MRKKELQLDLFGIPAKDKRNLPNSLIRSALFTVNNSEEDDNFLKEKEVHSLKNIKLTYTGYTLDQEDLDVWASLISLYPKKTEGDILILKTSEIIHSLTLSGLNRKAGSKDYDRIISSLMRLAKTRISVEFVNTLNQKVTYIGGLISSYEHNREIEKHEITFDPKIKKLFGINEYTRLDWNVRSSLKRSKLAKWLYTFYSTHNNKPFDYSYTELLALCGSKTKDIHKFKQLLKRAAEKVMEETQRTGENYKFEFLPKYLKVNKYVDNNVISK